MISPVGTVPDPVTLADTPFDVTVDYGQDVLPADANKLVPVNCGAAIESGTAAKQVWTFTISADALSTGTLTLNYSGGGYKDASGNDNLPAVEFSRDFDTTSPTTDIDIYVSGGTTTTLPAAREKMRFQAIIYADVTTPLPAGHTIDWSIDLPGAGDDMNDWFELVDDPVAPVDIEKILQTKVAGSAVTYIPDTWGGTTKTIPVSLSYKESGVETHTGTANLTMQVVETMDNIDLAILLDRSGSMGGNRWKSAMSGAAMFASFVAEICSVIDNGDGTWDTTPHRAGLYWFWGHNSYTYNNNGTMTQSNFPNPNPPVAGYLEGFHDFFTDSDGDTYQLPNGATLAKYDRISVIQAEGTTGPVPSSPADALVNTSTPNHFTALGSGLLFCRNALVAADPGHTRERVILMLSDGIENREPKIDKVFEGADPLWLHENGDASEPAENPLVRVYSNAVLTSTNWANKLRDVAQATGGIRSLDVKHITDHSQYGTLIRQWFVSSFKRLFDFVTPDQIPDPTLSKGQFGKHPIMVHLGNDKLIFYVLFEQPDGDKWEFGVIPPGQTGAIYTKKVDDYAGVKCFKDHMFKAIVVDLPLELDGHKHRWAGEWEMVVVREGEGSGEYAVGALAHQDLGTTVDIIAPPVPRPGCEARLRVELRNQKGKPITDASVSTTVHKPGPWPGHEVALEVSHNLELVKKLQQSRSKANEDTQEIADRVLRELYESGAITGGKSVKYTLKHIGKGVYEKVLRLDKPGEYDFDTSIVGLRTATNKELKAKIGDSKKKLPLYYSEATVRKEQTFLKKYADAKQKFKIESREQLNVSFLPAVSDSETGGFFMDDKKIRLLVQPAGAGGTLLGPGWADSISFEGPGGVDYPWPAMDTGDGNYRVDIPFEAKNPRFDRAGSTLVADRISLHHPTLGTFNPVKNELPLKGFCVTVLGIKMPLEVWALLGNRKSGEVHLITCQYASKIADKNKVWLHDLKQAKRLGYDTCEHCLPLICNTDPNHMEAHKLFCSHVRRIKTSNRIEVHNWSQAEKLGFNGCYYCLKDKHTK